MVLVVKIRNRSHYDEVCIGKMVKAVVDELLHPVLDSVLSLLGVQIIA